MNTSNSLLTSLRKIDTAMRSVAIKAIAINNNNNNNNTINTTNTTAVSDSWFDKIDSTMLLCVAGGTLVMYLVFKD